jgi:hypothetical protein
MIDLTTFDLQQLPWVSPTMLASLPPLSAVYFVLGTDDAVVSVGQTKNLH